MLVLACAIVVGVSSCEKEGCTDKDATNYNEEAKKDDGTCSFSADQFVGSYQLIDAEEVKLKITKTANNKIYLEITSPEEDMIMTATIAGNSYSTDDKETGEQIVTKFQVIILIKHTI